MCSSKRKTTKSNNTTDPAPLRRLRSAGSTVVAGILLSVANPTPAWAEGAEFQFGAVGYYLSAEHVHNSDLAHPTGFSPLGMNMLGGWGVTLDGVLLRNTGSFFVGSNLPLAVAVGLHHDFTLALLAGRGEGPFLGLSYHAYLYRNVAIYESLVETPHAELGILAAADKDLWMDLSVRFGIIGVGRHRVGHESSRKLNGMVSIGARSNVHIGMLHMLVDYAHLLSKWQPTSLGDVDTTSGSICVSDLYGACLDWRFMRGETFVKSDIEGTPRSSMVSSFYGGITIGVFPVRQ